MTGIRWLVGIALTVSLMMNAYLLIRLDYLSDTARPSPSRLPSALPSENHEPPLQLTNVQDVKPAAGSVERPGEKAARIARLIDTKRYADARYSLREALNAAPHRVSLLYLEARLLRLTAPLSDVVLHYYDMLDMPLTVAEHKQVEQRLQTLVKETVTSLKQAKSWTALAMFMEPLYQYAPGNRAYTLALATAYGEQQNITLMQTTLAALPVDDPAHRQFSTAYARSVVAPTGDVTQPDSVSTVVDNSDATISLLRKGTHFEAPVFIGDIQLSLLLDTGATQSAVFAASFEKIRTHLSYRFIGNFTIATASGSSQAALIEVDELQFGPYVLPDVKMFVLPEAAKNESDGLLGMNILGQFTFFIDQSLNTLYLKKDQ